MTTHDLADALEGKHDGHEWRCRCPVHGGRSLSITEKDGKLLVVCRAGCSQDAVIKALRDIGLWGNVTRYEIPPPLDPDPSELERKADQASAIWEQSSPIRPGDPVHRYLAGRGITLATWPEDLRCHPSLDYWAVNESGKPVKMGTYPSMLAVIRSPQGHPVGLHRTYITSDGRKAPVTSPKKIMKVHGLEGSAVRLSPPSDCVLAVCEGIEDALSAWVLWKIPTWACLGTSGMRTFQPPEDIRELMIFADNDEPGKKAAWELVDRMEEMGRAARVLAPEDGSKDLNAFLLARQGANMQEITR